MSMFHSLILMSLFHSFVPYTTGSLDRSVEGETAQIILNNSTDTSRSSQSTHSPEMALQVGLSLCVAVGTVNMLIFARDKFCYIHN